MRRIGRKREPEETLSSLKEFSELKSEIKTEPSEIQFLGNASILVSFCCLCKTSSGDYLSIFGSGPKHDPDIANKIQSCMGLEISSQAYPDPHICQECLQELEGHYAFQKQALKCNEYVQKQMIAAGAKSDFLPKEIRICRFCSINGMQLLDMYPGGESPEEDLIQKIRKCLAVEVNSWDPSTKICRNCIKSIDSLLEFRTRDLPTSEYIKDEMWHYGPSYLAKRIKQEDGDVSTQYVVPDLSVSDSDFSAKRIKQEDEDVRMQDVVPDLSVSDCAAERIKQEYKDTSKQDVVPDGSVSDSDCSAEDNDHIDSSFAGRQKLTAMRPELVQLLGADVDGKNFSTLYKDGEQMKVIFDDQLFRFHSERETGSSLWACDNSKLRNCRMKLEIDATGRCAALSSGVRSHTHPPGTAILMQCPLGKGMAEMNGEAEPFYMFCSRKTINQSLTNYTRSLIFQGFRYFLHQIQSGGIDSTWHCVNRHSRGCKSRLLCYGIFHKVEIDGEHNHSKLSQSDNDNLLLQHGIDTMSTDAISEFQNVNTIEKITEPQATSAKQNKKSARVKMKSVVKKNPPIFRLLNQDDAERNFEVIKTGEKLTVVKDSYEYRYHGELSDNSTIWKCVRDTLRRCKLMTKITPDGKQLEKHTGKHSHGTGVEEIFRYPLGMRMIGEEPLWLLNRVPLYNDRRSVVYKDHLFHIHIINQKGEVRWRCHKNDSCRALLTTKGNFQQVVLRNEHLHEKLPKSMISKLLDGSTTPKVDVDILLFKQKLLSYPLTKIKIWDAGENDYESLYILTDIKIDTRSGFIFRRNKFSFGSVEQSGTSKWRCWNASCKVVAIVEGLFETIVVAKQHAHEMLSDSMMEHLIASLPNSSGETVVKLEEKCNLNFPTDNILSILGRHDSERNFTMTRAKTKFLVNYEGEDFRLKSRDPESNSTWTCIWWEMRKCPVKLRMSADGKQVAYSDPQKQHNHADKQIGVFLQDLGKGQIYDKDEDIVSSYWLFSYQCEFRSNRGIIYKGNKYRLCSIGNNGVSVWICRYSKCKMFVRVKGTFKAILGKREHNHARLTDDEIKDITGQEEVDTDLLPGCEIPNVIVPTNNRPLRPSDVLKIMSLDDPDRNFQIKTHKEEMKVIQDGYEFVYRSSTPSHTLWRCIYSNIHYCRVTLLIDNDCKQAFKPRLPNHTHSLKPSNLYDYPLGESKIVHTDTETEQPFWFLVQPTFIRPKPFIIYENYKYFMVYIAEKSNNTFWRCCVARVCNAKLTVKGLFESVVVRGKPHTHPPLAQDKISKMIKLYGTPHESDTNSDT